MQSEPPHMRLSSNLRIVRADASGQLFQSSKLGGLSKPVSLSGFRVHCTSLSQWLFMWITSISRICTEVLRS